jgi:putative oxidoreductase
MSVETIGAAAIEAPPPRCAGGFAIFDAVVAWLLGVSLICSSVPHLGNPYFFLGSVYGYKLVGPGIGQIVAMVVPFLEVVLAACLITNLFRGAAHAITLSMLLVFVIVQTSAKLRGLDIPCGCFGPRHETAIGWFTLSVVYGLLFLALTRLLGHCWLVRTARQT